ncbi:MAG TPA: molybdopterin-dependent oxidoreductase [Acidimicrobiales bacterium]
MTERPTIDITRTEVRTCPLCEATCGLEIAFDGDRVVRVRGDGDDVFSGGYICPKGSALGKLIDDPDRIRVPLVRQPDGTFAEVTWDEAFATVERLLRPIIEAGDRNAIGAYVGNPNAHNLSNLVFNRPFLQALGSRNVFSASTVDQMPKQVAAGHLYGTILTIAIPDIDRTDLFVCMGANPLASNGSLFTAPDLPGRLKAMQARGGRIVVIDPRRSETAAIADRWIPIRPGTDAMLLAAMAHTIFEEDLVDPGAVTDLVEGLPEVEAAVAPFSPEVVAPACAIDEADIRWLAREVASTERAALYGRIGTCTQEFGTLASWLVDVVNVVAGNLDRPGGVMFPKPAAGSANTRGPGGTGRGFRQGRHHSRVRGLPEAAGELPVVAMAEEIDIPGEGQVRALITVAGNPVLSTPNSARLDAALAGLEAMVSVDIYLNETTRHADVILPAPHALQKSHYDLAFYQLSCRNVANYSPPLVPRDDDQLDEWEILARLALVLAGQGSDTAPAVVDDLVISELVTKAVRAEGSPVEGRDPDELIEVLSAGGRRGPDRILDFMLRTGPYGCGFGADPDGLSLDVLVANPHGVDLGPLEPRMPEILRTPSGHIELAPEPFLDDLPRLEEAVQRHGADGADGADRALVLVGRRHVRSNNSWMHNVEVLVKGKARHHLQMHPDDASRLGIVDGAAARVRSRVGELTVPVEVTDVVMPGVVSLPHGWGHDVSGVQMGVATDRAAGVNSNLLADENAFDPLSGNAVLNGIPVEVVAA